LHARCAKYNIKLQSLAGIYIHIPFCKKACHYCNFHFSTTLARKAEMVKAICTEIQLKKAIHSTENEIIETIYFGGGTPSLLNETELNQIIETVNKNFNINADAEITFETNPDDINTTSLSQWKRAGINRLSIGIQGFFEEELLWMNRAHDAKQALRCIPESQDRGFENISADLIFGGPLQTDEMLEKNLNQMIQFQVPHLSCYALTVEESTALHHHIKTGKSKNVDPELQAHFFYQVLDRLQQAGFEHYEISNYAKPGFESKHNSNYWVGVPYFGFGPAAHSFDGKQCRSWNISNNSIYLDQIQNKIIPVESEKLTQTQMANESIMIGLRTKHGLDLEKFRLLFGEKRFTMLTQQMQQFLHKKHLMYSEDEKNLQLTRSGKIYADGIAAELFVEGA
jgi:oxygen-independent coproporphyrinogen-3 oxidase